MFCPTSSTITNFFLSQKGQKTFQNEKTNNKRLAHTTKKKVTDSLFALGLAAISIVTILWVIEFFDSQQDYTEYCKTVNEQQGIPDPYYVWDRGRYTNLSLIALLFLWIPFTDHSLRKIVYPFLRHKLTYREAKNISHTISATLYDNLHRIVLGYFTRVNKKVKAKISSGFMKIETFEHLHLLTKVFKWIIFPSTVIYGFVTFVFFGQNTLDTLLVANLLFLYSNFVPDLPAVFRRKAENNENDAHHKELPTYRTYALLLFAQFFITLLFCGKKIKWKTTETFHNFKSLLVYGTFLFMLVFLASAAFPSSSTNLIETFSIPIFASLGYLTHLKVDHVF